MKHLLLLFSFLLLLSACGPKHEQPLVSRGTLTQYDNFQSKYVDARMIRVWTPTGYNPDNLYDVVYMNDAQMLYDADFSWNHQEWGVDEIVDSLIQAGTIRPCIIVGIDNHPKNRIGEYCPDDAAQFLPKGQQIYEDEAPLGNKYLQFIVEELKPFIDSTYSVHTDSTHTFMIGSSCGGLISSYALCKYPNVFGGVACLSTNCAFLSMGNTDGNEASTGAYIQYLKKYLPKANTHLLYMDNGDQTIDEKYVKIMPVIQKGILALGWDSKHFQYKFFPGAAHTETDWQARLPQILEFLLGK